MIQLPHYEELGIAAASDAAGKYLEQIGKTDLATLTAEEWDDLLKTIFVTTSERIRIAVETEEVPF